MMKNPNLNYRELLSRKPILIPLPNENRAIIETYDGQDVSEPEDTLKYQVLTQAEMLRQYYPQAHKINNPVIYPDVWKEMPTPGNPNKKRLFKQPITRTAFAFQRVLKIKQVVHVCGNDIQMELSSKEDNEKKNISNADLLLDLREGWLEIGNEERWFEAIDSIKTVSDAAVVFYFDEDNTPKTKTLSYLYGDKLYPHYDSVSGKMKYFARKYRDYDEEGKMTTEWVEVWDKKYLYRAKRDISNFKPVRKLQELFAPDNPKNPFAPFALSGYKMVGEPKEHGFEFVPVCYHRNEEGPCWIASQNTIEHYEEAVSYFFENNKAYAFPIFFVKGKGVKLSGNMNGAVKAVAISDPRGEAGFLNQEDVSTSYNTLLNLLYEKIFEQSFGVKPPELKSGDLPGVAVKLLFSPAIEQAICDAEKLQPFLDELVKMTKYAWGFYTDKLASLMNLKVRAWVEPYIHQNDAELMQNLATGVQNHFTSIQTASERATKYNKTDEFNRLMREDLEKRKKDNEDAIEKMRAQLRIKTEELEEQEKIKNKYAQGAAVNTGRGGRPNLSGRTYDDSRNWPGRNNWDKDTTI